MQSAEGFADTISDDCYTSDSHDCNECGWGQSKLDMKRLSDLIRARDREIVGEFLEWYTRQLESSGRLFEVGEILPMKLAVDNFLRDLG